MKRRRWLMKVVALLLAGTLINVALAWGASLLHQYIHHAHIITPVPPGWSTWPRVARVEMPARTMIHEETRFDASLFEQFDAEGAAFDVTNRYSAGWPCLSLYGELRGTTKGVQCIRPSFAVGSPVPWLLLMECRPIGIAVNTLFYAGVLWVLLAGPFALRRMIRRRRGLCAACAYPVGTSDVCTECGRLVMPANADIQ